MLQLTQKEKMLLQDQQKHEQICIEKYTNYANQAQDPKLKQLFQSYAQQEQTHLDTINQLLNGQIPNMNQQSQSQSQNQAGQNNQMNLNSMSQNPSVMQGAMASQADVALCNDMLMTEKYVSNAYDTAIFEFTNAEVRQVLNHIQKEEQQHGEGIFNYMSSQGMYNPQ